jgi:hypothetical protein
MANTAPSNSGSTLGQFRDEFLDQTKGLATDTAKALVTEPAKILEQILGGKPNTSGDEAGTGESDPGQQGAQDPIAAAQKQAALLAQKRAADQQKSQQLHSMLVKQIKDAEIQSVEEEKQREKAGRRNGGRAAKTAEAADYAAYA